MTTMSATSAALAPDALSVRHSTVPLLRPVLAVAAALVAMAAFLGLRLGLYAATHGFMPIFHRLFE